MKREQFTDILKTKLEIIVGDRFNAKQSSAVLRKDLAEFARLTAESTEATATPTQAEFNALVYDVHQIIDALNAIGEELIND